jgi:ribokinase
MEIDMAAHPTDAGRVFVFGSANHDHVLAVAQFPQAGETVLAGEYANGLGGKGANQAVAAARAGGDVVFVGAVGDDQPGERIVENFADHGIDTRFTARSDAPTGLAFVLVDADGGNEIVVAPGANATLAPRTVSAALEAVTAADVVVVQCEIPVERLDEAVRGGARGGATVIVNLAPYTVVDPSLFARISVLVVNESEARSLLASTGPVDDLAVAVVRAVGCACIVTLGERGSIFASPDGRRARVPAAPVPHVVDTTGAGDVYVGTLAAALARTDDIVSAMGQASEAAARSVSHPGAQSRPPQPMHEPVG